MGIGKYNNESNTLKSAWPLTVDGAVSASGAMTGTNITGSGWIWSKGNLFFGGQLQYYDEANSASYTIFNPSSKRIDAERISANEWLQSKKELYFGTALYGYDFATNASKKIADKDGKLYGTDITATGKITAATASLGAAPPEVVNQSFWQAIAIAKLFRGISWAALTGCSSPCSSSSPWTTSPASCAPSPTTDCLRPLASAASAVKCLSSCWWASATSWTYM